jgi:hypothetical protein
MPNLRSSLDDLAANFAAAVLAAIRGASLRDLLDAQELPRKGGRRSGVFVRADALNGYLHLKGQKTGDINGSVTSTPSSRRLARRSPADIARALDAVVILVRKSKTGMRSEEIRKALRLDVREVPRVLKEGLAKKKLRSKGQKRATTYSAV